MSHVDEGTLHAFLDGELTDGDARRLEEHVGACAACAERLDEAARVRALAGDLVAASREAGESAPDWAELVARARRREATGTPSTTPAGTPGDAPAGGADDGRRRRLRDWAPTLAWAATLALAFTLGWEASRLSPSQPFEAPAEEAVRRQRTAEPGDGEGEGDPGRTAATEPATPEPAATDETPGAPSPELRTLRQPAEAARPSPTEPVAPPTPRAAAPEPTAKESATAATGRTAADGQGTSADSPTSPDAAGFRPVSLEEARRWLDRRPLELQGAELLSASVGPAGLLPGRPALRLRYHDPVSGREIVVSQQAIPIASVGEPGGALTADDRVERGTPEAASPRLAATLRELDGDGLPGLEGADLAGLESPDVTVRPDGGRTLRWLHPAGYLVTLDADLDEATLRELLSRLR